MRMTPGLLVTVKRQEHQFDTDLQQTLPRMTMFIARNQVEAARPHSQFCLVRGLTSWDLLSNAQGLLEVGRSEICCECES